jgi:3-methyladenine DNA glycosylase AlkD
MEAKEILRSLKKMYNPKNVEGMVRFGINPKNTMGISVTDLRKMATLIGKNHNTAIELWKSGIHEARILATIIDEPHKVTEDQVEKWVQDFDSWDICDQACVNLFIKTGFYWKKSVEWSGRTEEFQKRAGFSLMAVMAVHDKNSKDEKFIGLLSIIKNNSNDERNYVKKAVNWALRQIGKRNTKLNREAIKTSNEILALGTKTAVWIASDALRELKSDSVIKRLEEKNSQQNNPRK